MQIIPFVTIFNVAAHVPAENRLHTDRFATPISRAMGGFCWWKIVKTRPWGFFLQIT